MKRRDFHQLADRARAMTPPVLSLYVPFTPGAGDRDRVAASRAHAAMRSAGVPDEVRARVEQTVATDQPRGRTLAVFASADALETAWLPTAVPVDQTGTAYARWGHPDITPLWFLESNRRPALVVYVDRDHLRLFDATADEVDEIARLDRPISEAELEPLQQSKQERPAYTASRGGAALDNAHEHVAELSRRFHADGARIVEDALDDDVELVLMGPPVALADFESVLAAATRRRISARLGGLTSPEAGEAELRERIVPTLRRIRDEVRRQLLERVARARFIGLGRTVDGIQRGRVATVVAAWPILEREVYEHRDTGYVALDRKRARLGPGEVRAVALPVALQQLCRRYGAAIELLDGDAADELIRDFDGFAGLTRW